MSEEFSARRRNRVSDVISASRASISFWMSRSATMREPSRDEATRDLADIQKGVPSALSIWTSRYFTSSVRSSCAARTLATSDSAT